MLRFALDGTTVRTHRVESAVLGDWLRAFQNAVQSVAYALDELRPTRDAGPVPKDVQRATKLFSGVVFASSYGMVLEGVSEEEAEHLPSTGADALLDRAINRLFDVADRASSGADAGDAVLDAALPLGRRAITHLTELSDVLASTGTGVTLSWESKATIRRTSSLSAESADRCRKVLRAAEVEDTDNRLVGTVVGGSTLRGFIELDLAEEGVVIVRAPKDHVTGLLAAYTEREVVADVRELTARSAGGRVHRSYLLLDLSLNEDAAEE
ncbi:hypothetical protein [Streptomyces sp. bgisy100]|uniref:hypothetical protein n=1 Tax=Streptomyces sp. bgisy100 TaxID=3413783 RepID=UPI003D70F0F5